MKRALRHVIAAVALMLWAIPSLAQTADEIIEKHLAATGGRAALSKVTSRVSNGTITLTTPIGDLKGTIELYQKKPNKTRTLIKLDATALGGGQIVSDQRFDGTIGYVIDSFQGNRDITGDQLDAMKSGGFPTPFLNYKESGMTAALGNREKVDTRDVYVIQLTITIDNPSVDIFRMLSFGIHMRGYSRAMAERPDTRGVDQLEMGGSRLHEFQHGI